jgi:2-amino-4-hydroxy-6-hydroxymethyldihydropteridine diphosphokinase
LSCLEAVPVRFALGLGSNLDVPERQLLRAIRELSVHLGPLAVAPLYRTLPRSPIPQPMYLNTVVIGESRISPRELLKLAKGLERDAGRSEGPAWGPRPLDIDLLLYGEQRINEPELEIPHPRLTSRRFVLAPLADVAPDWAVPPQLRTVASWLDDVGQETEVERIAWSEGS